VVQVNDNTQKKNTLNQRYFYKLSSNVISIFAGVFTSAIVPRALGVSSYGDFSFVNNVITQILSFLDMRASTCFYVKLSQRQSESKIITFYGIYTILVFVLLLIIITTLTFPFSRQYLFESIDTRIIWFSFFFVGIKWVADIFIKISDAYGTTKTVEKIKMINQVLGVFILAALYYFKLININIFYLHQIVMFSLLVFLLCSFFKKNKYEVPLIKSMGKATFRNYAKEFILYSSPLAFYLVASLITEIFDRYILQHYGGSYQQGLYGFSFSMSSMTILFVTSMVPLFTRELSIALSTNDVGMAASLYRKYVPTLYVISAYFCCFLFVNADSVIMLLGGEQYKESLIPLKVMLLYPLVSTYSGLNSSVIYAKSGTTFIRNITMVLSPLGMITTYILIANNFMNMGATGLAIKVLLLELISVFIMLLYISKYLEIKLYRYFLHMIFAPFILLALAFAIKAILLFYSCGITENFFAFIGSGLIYTILFGLIIYFFPIIIGLSRENITTLIDKLKSLKHKYG
jgi:O-antigen/teichoic acid export membrane protein